MRGIIGNAGPLALLIVPVGVALYAARRLNRPSGNESAFHAAAFAVFSIYILLIGMLTLGPPMVSSANGSFGTNLVPVLWSIGCFVPDPGQPSTTAFCLQTIGGNFALFVPLGFLVPLIWDGVSSARALIVVATGTSIAIEVFQYAGRWLGTPRWTDVDDVLFNVAGGLVGYALLRSTRFVIARLNERWRSPGHRSVSREA